MKKKKAFTLIELLVVISIMILLMSITIVTILYYKNKAIDSRIASSLTETRKIAEMVFSSELSYSLLCDASHSFNESSSELKKLKDDIKKFNSENPVCWAAEKSYCVQAKMVSVSGGYYCVDNSGIAGFVANCSGTNISCSAL